MSERETKRDEEKEGRRDEQNEERSFILLTTGIRVRIGLILFPSSYHTLH